MGLGLSLIAGLSALLLVSDWAGRRSARRLPSIALLQVASYALVDEGVRGVFEGLRAKGYEENRTMLIRRFNAQSDLPTLNNMAKAIAGGEFDMVVTVTTPALQAMAAANRDRKMPHVFGLVTDPFASGVGLRKEAPLDHPPYLVGIGSFQPVREIFQLARKVFPGLHTAGTVWNPAEACSQACVMIARAACHELGIELLEAQVENSSGVLEAANSLVARGVQAVIVGGDNTVEQATPMVIKAAAQAHIPVMVYEATWAERGAMLGLGANYFEVGKTTGELAGDVLGGRRDPATIPIVDVLPKRLGLNLSVLANLRDPWRVPPDMLAAADIGVDEKGVPWNRATAPVRPGAKTTGPVPSGAPKRVSKKWKIHLIELVDAPVIEATRQGVLSGLREAGLVEGRDYEVRLLDAQGDIAALSSLIDAALTGQADMVYTITTPALQAAMNKVRDRPVLFALALDPLLIGDEGAHAAHRANVAGVFNSSPFEGMMKLVRECLPDARSIGTLFSPSEANSVNFRNELERAAKQAGLRLVAVPSNSPAEVPDAALALTQRGIDAVCQIDDNLHGAAFPAIAAAARRARLPVFAFAAAQASQGAAVVLSNDHFDEGRESALIAAQVIRGASPAQFPYRSVTKTKLIVNPQAALAAKIKIPGTILRRAEIAKQTRGDSHGPVPASRP